MTEWHEAIGAISGAVAAVGTVAAVGWAIWTTLSERRKRIDVEQELAAERQTSREIEKRRQATQVTGWVERDGVRVGNYSQAPIFNVLVQADSDEAEVGDVSPERRRTILVTQRDMLPPNSEHYFGLTLSEQACKTFEAEFAHGRDYRVGIVFRDVAGNWWRRTGHGSLKEHLLGSEEAPLA